MPSQTPPDIRSLIGQTFERSLTMERGLVNLEERTVPFSFSSEVPVERWYGLEILDHSPGAADLSRLNSGGPMLVCHDRYDQCGAVLPRSAVIGQDRVGRAVCFFSQSDRGKEIMNDVNDGIRTTTSFRYIPREMVLESSKDDVDTYRVTKWEALETSWENIPADTSVGAGRALELEALRSLTLEAKRAAFKEMAEREGFTLILDQVETRTNPIPPAAPPAPATDSPTQERTSMPDQPTAVTPTPPSADVLRVADIIALGELAGQRTFAEELAFGETPITIEEARTKIAAKRAAAQPKVPAESAETIAARNGEQEPARVLSRVSLRAFRGPKAQEDAHRTGQYLLGYVFDNAKARQWCADHGVVRTTPHSESDNESGGVFVLTEHENAIIDLREEYGTFRKFAKIITMNSDKKDRPRRTGGLQAYPIGARGGSRRLTLSKKGWDKVGLEAKKWGVLAKYEDELSEDAIIGIADDLTEEGSYAFTVTEDECGFLGDGTGDFHGITGIIPKIEALSATKANIAGMVVASGTGADKWAEIAKADILKLMGRLPKFAYKRGATWHCSNAFWSEVMLRIITDAGGVTANEMQEGKRPLFFGYPVEISQVLPQVPEVAQVPLVFGNIASGVMFGDRRGVTVKQTDSNDTDFEEDLQSVKMTERFDIVVHDVGNADATASNRKAGPIVVLRTKAS